MDSRLTFRLTLALMRPFIWLRRFRHRRGYGVHSPFAFGFIKGVAFERAAYYKYVELREQERQMARREGRTVLYEGRRVRRLLFRIANYARPDTLLDVGTPAASSLYLRAARTRAVYVQADTMENLPADGPVDFLYVHDYRRPEQVEAALRLCLPRATRQSVFVVEGVRYTPAMTHLWKRLRRHPGVGVTFDLFDVGVVFFDPSIPKQDYIVNF